MIWNIDEKLKWNSFRGNPEASDFTAFISSTIEFKKAENGKWLLYAFMNKNLSWHKWRANECLPHEQYHFNITELFARKIRKEIAEKKVQIGSTEFRNLFNEKLMQLYQMQSKYDKETNHSIIKQEQIRWQNEIDVQLKELVAYINPVIE